MTEPGSRRSKQRTALFGVDAETAIDNLVRAVRKLADKSSDPAIQRLAMQELEDFRYRKRPVRLTPSEDAALVARARSSGLTVSEYIRSRALGAPIRSNVSAEIVAALIRFSVLHRRRHPDETEQIDAIERIIRMIGGEA